MFVPGRSVLAISVLLEWAGHLVEAQRSDAVCTSKHAWMLNSKGQTPCLVAAYLNLPCLDGGSGVMPMKMPSQFCIAHDEVCECNTVLYALFQACQACQFDNGTVVNGHQYTHNCTQNNLKPSYPIDIPNETAVPAWAYQDVTATGLFNSTAASAVAAEGHPDTTATAVLYLKSTTFANSFATTPSLAATGASSSSSSSGFTGPLVGANPNRHAPHEQSTAFLSSIYPASLEWVYEPWSPMSPTRTVLNLTSPVGTGTHPQPYPFAGLGQSSSAGSSPVCKYGLAAWYGTVPQKLE
ncbi:hypothetical protein C8T65DRAFT_775048 [Cerioporus squamosus]|nr:hypothetical protein C8T65DRAFT_775048 [Cerioporus squamosus]